MPDVDQRDVYLCGSPGWMDAAERAALDAGVPREPRPPRALRLLTPAAVKPGPTTPDPTKDT